MEPEKLLNVLKIIKKHEGTWINDFDSPMYKELYDLYPNDRWAGKGKKYRSWLRGYQKFYTEFELLVPTIETKQRVYLTENGRILAETGAVAEYYRSKMEEYVEKWKVNDRISYLSPFEFIAAALLFMSVGGSSVSISDIEDLVEKAVISYVCKGDQNVLFAHPQKGSGKSDQNHRKFRSYLTILDGAKVIHKSPGQIDLLDEKYLFSLVQSEHVVGVYDSGCLDDCADYDSDLPNDIDEDLRVRRSLGGYVRQGQQSFNRKLKRAYGSKCCITGTLVEDVLEAAHIIPYRGPQTNLVSNGLLLASDIHKLFDSDNLLINPDTLRVELRGSALEDERYRHLNGSRITPPRDGCQSPNKEALKRRYSLANKSE